MRLKSQSNKPLLSLMLKVIISPTLKRHCLIQGLGTNHMCDQKDRRETTCIHCRNVKLYLTHLRQIKAQILFIKGAC